MITAHLILMILAFLCLVMAALEVKAPRVDLLALGLSFWALAQIVA